MDARWRRASIVRATSSVELGKDIVTVAESESEETTHFSVIDKDGNAVANTYTLEGGYGSHVVVKGAGFILNNEMGDFNKKPGETNPGGDIGTPANLIAPGKRMLSSMTPTIVTRDGKVMLVTGSPGAGRSQYVFDIVLNVTEFGMMPGRPWMLRGCTTSGSRTTDPGGQCGARGDARASSRMGHTIRMQGGQGDGPLDPRGSGHRLRVRRERQAEPDSKASR